MNPEHVRKSIQAILNDPPTVALLRDLRKRAPPRITVGYDLWLLFGEAYTKANRNDLTSSGRSAAVALAELRSVAAQRFFKAMEVSVSAASEVVVRMPSVSGPGAGALANVTASLITKVFVE